MIMKTQVPTVFVVDDDDAVRGAMRLLFKSVGIPVRAFECARAFLDAYSGELAGCALLDVRMPGMSGPALQEQLRQRGASLPVIFVTGHGDVSMAVEAIQRGAFDFIEKPFTDQDLLERVQRAFEADGMRKAELSRRDFIQGRIESLTPREREVLQHVTRGSSNKRMAYELSISQRTVEIHRARVMEKMQASSLAQLVRMTRETAAQVG